MVKILALWITGVFVSVYPQTPQLIEKRGVEEFVDRHGSDAFTQNGFQPIQLQHPMEHYHCKNIDLLIKNVPSEHGDMNKPITHVGFSFEELWRNACPQHTKSARTSDLSGRDSGHVYSVSEFEIPSFIVPTHWERSAPGQLDNGLYFLRGGLPNVSDIYPYRRVAILIGPKHNLLDSQVSSGLCLPNITGDSDSIISGSYGPAGLYKGVSNPNNTKASYKKRAGRDDHHPKRQAGHILLSIKVLSGLGLILCGLGGFNHTLAQGGRLSANTSGQRTFFYCLIMLTGAYLIATNVHASGLPRCEDDGGNPNNYHTMSECF